MENGEVEMCRERDLEEKKKESIRERMGPREVRSELGAVRREKKGADKSKSGRSTTFVSFELCVITHFIFLPHLVQTIYSTFLIISI